SQPNRWSASRERSSPRRPRSTRTSAAVASAIDVGATIWSGRVTSVVVTAGAGGSGRAARRASGRLLLVHAVSVAASASPTVTTATLALEPRIPPRIAARQDPCRLLRSGPHGAPRGRGWAQPAGIRVRGGCGAPHRGDPV